MAVSDNGIELTSEAILAWVDQSGVARHYIVPGEPMQKLPSSKGSMAGCAMNC